MRRTRVRLLIGTILSLIFLYLAIRGIRWSEFIAVLGETRWRFLIPAACLTLIGHYFRAYRWKYMLLPVKRIRTWSLYSATVIGLMANNLLPARLGEIMRVYVIGRAESISKSASFATIICERIVDVFGLLVLLWLTLLKTTGPPWLQKTGIIVLGLNIALFLFLLFVIRYGDLFIKLLKWLGRALPEESRAKIVEAFDNFTTGLESLGNGRVFLPLVWISVLVWLAPIFRAYFCLLALDMHLPLFASVAVIVLVSLGSMIPSAPGYIGTTQYACIIALAMFGIGKGEALAYSILFHATQLLPNTLGGLFFLWRAGLRLGEIPEEYQEQRA